MNRRELANGVARRLGTTVAGAEAVVDAVLAEVEHGLVADGRASLRGFGVFTSRDRAARRLLHPRSAEPITLRAHRTVHFRPGAELLRQLERARNDGSAAEDQR